MPSIEVLPNSTSISAPGWAYVPDVGYDPSKTAIQPSGARKRAARTAGIAGGDTTARQQNANLKHLLELDKDNHRDVQIPVPARFKEKTGSKTKTTPAVRRILMSQKTFANHLADEEAAIASQEQQVTPLAPRTPALAPSRNASMRRRSSTVALEPLSASRVPSEVKKPYVLAEKPETFVSEDAGSHDPLLRSYIPEMPSPAVMETLLAGPPLSYNAARSVPTIGKPARHFCEICGYWGRIRCLKCGARVCGLDCKNAHDEGRCLKFYA
ncbi:MAG: hypothetical protein L6R40_001389 [Gallowayella cf. fulva]|nr:MAG: hypothetical protein L6R40_001389 [Xanthomendoza cf. fulva]